MRRVRPSRAAAAVVDGCLFLDVAQREHRFAGREEVAHPLGVAGGVVQCAEELAHVVGEVLAQVLVQRSGERERVNERVEFGLLEDGKPAEGAADRRRFGQLFQTCGESGRLVDAVETCLLETGEGELEDASALGGDRDRVDQPVGVGDERGEGAVDGGIPFAADLVQDDHEAGMGASDPGCGLDELGGRQGRPSITMTLSRSMSTPWESIEEAATRWTRS